MGEGGQVEELDVVAVLVGQHARIRDLFDEVERAAGTDKAVLFERLIWLVAVHETAEEEIVHPYVRRTLSGGQEMVDRMLRAERQAKGLLQQIEVGGVEDPQFMAGLRLLREAVLTHAEAEEREEFPHLMRLTSATERYAMGAGVKAAEVLASVGPRPATNPGAHNLLTGPLAAATDQTRDLIRGGSALWAR